MSYTKLTTETDKDFGHFNELPGGFKITTKADFYERFFMYCIGGIIFRQPRINNCVEYLFDGEVFGDIKMFPLTYNGCHDIGYGIAQAYHTRSQTRRLVFFRFGTDEKWALLNNRMSSLNAGDNS